jgi:hypothetical protein
MSDALATLAEAFDLKQCSSNCTICHDVSPRL